MPVNTTQLDPRVTQTLILHTVLPQILWGFKPRLTSAFRTTAEQRALFANPAVFALPPGTSQHEFGLAYDIAPQVSPGQPLYGLQAFLLAYLGEQLGMTWGGPNEPWHFQAATKRDWEEMLESLRIETFQLPRPSPFDTGDIFPFEGGAGFAGGIGGINGDTNGGKGAIDTGKGGPGPISGGIKT